MSVRPLFSAVFGWGLQGLFSIIMSEELKEYVVEDVLMPGVNLFSDDKTPKKNGRRLRSNAA